MAEQSELDKRPVEEQDVDAELEAMFEVCLFLRLLLSSCYSHPQWSQARTALSWHAQQLMRCKSSIFHTQETEAKDAQDIEALYAQEAETKDQEHKQTTNSSSASKKVPTPTLLDCTGHVLP